MNRLPGTSPTMKNRAWTSFHGDNPPMDTPYRPQEEYFSFFSPEKTAFFPLREPCFIFGHNSPRMSAGSPDSLQTMHFLRKKEGW